MTEAKEWQVAEWMRVPVLVAAALQVATTDQKRILERVLTDDEVGIMKRPGCTPAGVVDVVRRVMGEEWRPVGEHADAWLSLGGTPWWGDGR